MLSVYKHIATVSITNLPMCQVVNLILRRDENRLADMSKHDTIGRHRFLDDYLKRLQRVGFKGDSARVPVLPSCFFIYFWL